MAFLGDNLWIFIAMVFGAVVLLTQGMVVPILGDSAKSRRRLNQRVRDLAETASGNVVPESLLHSRHRRKLGPLERQLEALPFMARWRMLVEQAGLQISASRLLLFCFAAGLTSAAVAQMYLNQLLLSIPLGIACSVAPLLYVSRMRRDRIHRFEEQLPDAIDVMVRGLKAGHPFSEAMRLVSTELPAPLGREFATTFHDINYGGDVRGAFVRLLSRVPSVTVMAVVTAVLVQRETGGNLAEILEKIASVIRGRFKFQRKLRTLSAEGRISAWVLTMTPLVLFAMISLVNPTYMPMLLGSPYADTIIGGAIVLMVVGVFWIQRILKIEV